MWFHQPKMSIIPQMLSKSGPAEKEKNPKSLSYNNLGLILEVPSGIEPL